MNLEIKKEKSNIILNASSTEKEFLDLETKAISDINNKISLPGFRKGKVADEIIRKRFENEIKEQILENFANKVYLKYSEDNIHELTENPRLVEFDIKDNKIFIEILIPVFPEVSLDQYKGLDIKREKIEVSKEDIDDALKYIANKNSKAKTSDDNIAKVGDIANIDYTGFINGEEFDSQKGYDLRLGSNSFIEGFETQIEGHKRGDEFEIEVRFPENYPKFANKLATFKITLNDIKTVIVPDVDDELAKMENFESIDTLIKDLENKLILTKQKDEDEKFFREIISIIKSRNVLEFSEELIEKEFENKIQKLEEDLIKKSITLKEYYESKGISEEEFKNKLRLEAEDDLKEMAIIRAIIKEEKIDVEDKEVESYLIGIFGEKLNKDHYNEFSSQIKSGLKLNKVKKFLIENN